MLGLGAVKDAVLGALGTGYSECLERVPDLRALGVLVDQHRDVACLQRPITEADATGLGSGEQAGDFRGHRGRGPGPGLGLGQRLVLRAAQEHPQRGGVAPPLLHEGGAWRIRGTRGRKGDAREPEGVRVGAEQGVERGHEPGDGALVLVQGVDLPAALTGPEVGVDIGAAEAVDRLLGIADQEQRVATVPVDAPEDGVLERVGVLELVDERRGIALPQQGGERLAPRAGECVVYVFEKRVVGLQAGLAQPLFEGRMGLLEQRLAQRPEARLERAHQRLMRGQESSASVKNSWLGGAPVLAAASRRVVKRWRRGGSARGSPSSLKYASISAAQSRTRSAR